MLHSQATLKCWTWRIENAALPIWTHMLSVTRSPAVTYSEWECITLNLTEIATWLRLLPHWDCYTHNMPLNTAVTYWGGLKKNAWRNFFGRGEHACGFLFNFSKVTENAIITIKLLIFFHIFSDVAIGPENSPSLNWNIIDCYVIIMISTFKYYK